MGPPGDGEAADNGENKKMKRMGWLVLGAVLVLSGCGYTTRSMISNKYRSIYITPFVNKIDITKDTDTGRKYKVYRPLLETDITRSVNDKFHFDGNLKLADANSADLTLKGEVMEFVRDPLRYTDGNDVEEYRLNIRVNLSLWDNRENRLVWEESNFTGDTTYFTEFYPVAADRKPETTAINEAIKDLARRIVERTVEEW